VLKVSYFGAYAFILFLLVNWPTQVEDILSVLMPLQGFEEKITQGGVLGMIQWSREMDSVVIQIGSSNSCVGMYQFLRRSYLLTLKLNVEFILYHPL
jgi:hypothetical protein